MKGLPRRPARRTLSHLAVFVLLCAHHRRAFVRPSNVEERRRANCVHETRPTKDAGFSILVHSSFDASKSTKGASKLRRDLINTEIGHLRDLLPLPASTRQRLSQLQLMALVCVYVRKANYFQQGECFIALLAPVPTRPGPARPGSQPLSRLRHSLKSASIRARALLPQSVRARGDDK